jgi:hypothetical protein
MHGHTHAAVHDSFLVSGVIPSQKCCITVSHVENRYLKFKDGFDVSSGNLMLAFKNEKGSEICKVVNVIKL